MHTSIWVWHSEQPLQSPRSSEVAFPHLTVIKLFERFTCSPEFCSQTAQPHQLSPVFPSESKPSYWLLQIILGGKRSSSFFTARSLNTRHWVAQEEQQPPSQHLRSLKSSVASLCLVPWHGTVARPRWTPTVRGSCPMLPGCPGAATPLPSAQQVTLDTEGTEQVGALTQQHDINNISDIYIYKIYQLISAISECSDFPRENHWTWSSLINNIKWTPQAL